MTELEDVFMLTAEAVLLGANPHQRRPEDPWT